MLPRSIANLEAFENAMTLDIAMGGSTNTVLHLLAAAQEAGVPFTMADIDASPAACPTCARWRPPRPMSIWKMCIGPAASIGILGGVRPWRLASSRRLNGALATLGAAIDHWDVIRDGIRP